MIEKIEDPHTYPGAHALFSEGQGNRACDLQVKRRKARKTIDVSWSNICAELVFNGVWESCVEVINRYNCQVPRPRKRAPEKETVRCIKGEPPAGIWLDHRLGKIAKELIEIVQIAERSRANIGSIEHTLMHFVLSCELEFPVGIT